jgi:hypothetical protein
VLLVAFLWPVDAVFFPGLKKIRHGHLNSSGNLESIRITDFAPDSVNRARLGK